MQTQVHMYMHNSNGRLIMKNITDLQDEKKFHVEIKAVLHVEKMH